MQWIGFRVFFFLFLFIPRVCPGNRPSDWKDDYLRTTVLLCIMFYYSLACAAFDRHGYMPKCITMTINRMYVYFALHIWNTFFGQLLEIMPNMNSIWDFLVSTILLWQCKCAAFLFKWERSNSFKLLFVLLDSTMANSIKPSYHVSVVTRILSYVNILAHF